MERVSNICPSGTVQLSSGKFAIVEKTHEFRLVPWRPVIDPQLGREVMGVVQCGSVGAATGLGAVKRSMPLSGKLAEQP